MHHVTRKPCYVPAGAGEPGVPIDSDHVDHQSVSFPVAHRVAIKLGRRIFWMRASIGPNSAEGRIQLSQYHDLLISLNDLQRIWVLGHKTRDAERLTSQTGLCFLLRSKSFCLQRHPRLERRTLLRSVLRVEPTQGRCALSCQIEVSRKTHKPNSRQVRMAVSRPRRRPRLWQFRSCIHGLSKPGLRHLANLSTRRHRSDESDHPSRDAKNKVANMTFHLQIP